FYPFPIAFPYRLLDGIVDPEKLLRQQFRVVEDIIAFVASITLALLEQPLALLEQPPSPAEKIAPRYKWRKGLSLGDWLNISRRCSSALTETKGGDLSIALKSLWHR